MQPSPILGQSIQMRKTPSLLTGPELQEEVLIKAKEAFQASFDILTSGGSLARKPADSDLHQRLQPVIVNINSMNWHAVRSI